MDSGGSGTPSVKSFHHSGMHGVSSRMITFANDKSSIRFRYRHTWYMSIGATHDRDSVSRESWVSLLASQCRGSPCMLWHGLPAEHCWQIISQCHDDVRVPLLDVCLRCLAAFYDSIRCLDGAHLLCGPSCFLVFNCK